MNKLKQELKSLSAQELVFKIEAMRRELFSLRLHTAKAPVKDQTQFKKLRKAIACGLTLMRQQQDSQK